jgi:hypothetical protein
LVWHHSVQGFVRPIVIVDSFSLVGQVLGVGHGVHDLSGKLFSSEPSVEQPDEAVLPGGAGVDRRGPRRSSLIRTRSVTGTGSP